MTKQVHVVHFSQVHARGDEDTGSGKSTAAKGRATDENDQV
jgi:hypothetical protein